MKKIIPSVHIVGSECTYGIPAMFLSQGWNISDSLQGADLVQFTGGADVSPEYYGEGRYNTTFCNRARDKFEHLVFEMCRREGIPMAGICRGGQFLNVMCGGKMWQEVDGHGLAGTHKAKDHVSEWALEVTSTHHQMMRPAEAAQILMTAQCSHRKIRMCGDKPTEVYSDKPDIESCFYLDQGALCYQPHPEYEVQGNDGNRECYFAYLELCFNLRGG